MCLALAAVVSIDGPRPLRAQLTTDAQVGNYRDFYIVPFWGLPAVRGTGGSQVALGLHVVWPGPQDLSLSGRYESRWLANGARYDAARVAPPTFSSGSTCVWLPRTLALSSLAAP